MKRIVLMKDLVPYYVYARLSWPLTMPYTVTNTFLFSFVALVTAWCVSVLFSLYTGAFLFLFPAVSMPSLFWSEAQHVS